MSLDVIAVAAEQDLAVFLRLAFPPAWKPIAARILESGAAYGDANIQFAPRWTPVPRTMRYGRTPEETALKTIIFRVHDCLHQLWGLPVPRSYMDEKERSYFKRMWMCAEVAVLTLTEFFYCKWLYDTQPHLRDMLERRNTLLFKRTSSLRDETMLGTALVLDSILHPTNYVYPGVEENEYGRKFVADYGPMLAQDRVNIDHNWKLLRDSNFDASTLPAQTYSRASNGLEMTSWMIRDFEHLLETNEDVDVELCRFNAARRAKVTLPATWNTP